MIGALVYTIGAIVEGIIGLRFLFKLLGANPDSGFVNWIYSWSAPFVAPFKGIFGQDNTSTATGTAVTGMFDWAALIAFIVVGIILAIISGAIMRRRRVVV
jgi:hypothetical protein